MGAAECVRAELELRGDWVSSRTAGKAVSGAGGSAPAPGRPLAVPTPPRFPQCLRSPASAPRAAAAPRWRRRSSRPWRVSARGRGRGCSAWRPLPPRPRSAGLRARGGRGAEGGGRPGRNSRGAGGGGNSRGAPALRGGGLGTGIARPPWPLAREGAHGGDSRGPGPGKAAGREGLGGQAAQSGSPTTHNFLRRTDARAGCSPTKSKAGKEAPPACTAGSGRDRRPEPVNVGLRRVLRTESAASVGCLSHGSLRSGRIRSWDLQDQRGDGPQAPEKASSERHQAHLLDLSERG